MCSKLQKQKFKQLVANGWDVDVASDLLKEPKLAFWIACSVPNADLLACQQAVIGSMYESDFIKLFPDCSVSMYK